MTGTPDISPAASGGKLVLGLVGVCLAVIFVASVLFRLENPGLTVPGRTMPGAGHGGEGGMPGMGDMGNVRALMQKLQEQPGDPETLLALSRAFMQMEAWPQAKVFIDDLLSKDPENEPALTMAGVVAYHQEDYAGAAGIYEKLLAKNPANVMAAFNLGILFKHYLNRPDEGRALLEGLLAAHPDDARLGEMVRQELEAPVAAPPEGGQAPAKP